MSLTDENISEIIAGEYEGFMELVSAMEEKFKERGLPDETIRESSGLLKHGLKINKLQVDIKAQEQLVKNLTIRSQSHEEENGGVTTQKKLRDKNFMMRAEQLKILFNLRDELHLTVERMRAENLAHIHRELHPLNKEVCPICLHDIPITCVKTVQYFSCCGNFICLQCLQSSVAGGRVRMKKCPCCREEITCEMPEKAVRQVEEHAKRGRPWAQTTMGIYFLEGSSCEHGNAVYHKYDVKEALKWLKLAAEQKQPDAIRIIAQLHCGVYGEVKEVEQCEIKAKALMKEAANLGNLRAQRNYAMMCRLGQGGPVDKTEAAHYYTLAYSQKGLLFEKDEVSPLNYSDDLPEEVLHAGLFLGIYHYYGHGGFSKNLRTAKYYLEEYVKESEKQCLIVGPMAYMYLAACLMELQESECGQNILDFSIPGYSSVPRAMTLYRKSVEWGVNKPNPYSQHSKEVIEKLVTRLKNYCGNCGVASADIPERRKMKACGRCHSVWYCGKDCQTEHWKAGHKRDCVRQQV